MWLTWLAAVAAICAVGFVGVPDAEGGGVVEGVGSDDGGDDTGGDDGNDADADAGDGDANDDDDAGDGAGDNGDRRADGGTDDDDDEDADLPDDVKNDPKRLRTRLRRTQRYAQAARPIAERFRDRNGRFLSEQELDRTLGRARDMEDLEGFFQEHPDVLQTILDRKRGKGRPAAGESDDEVFQDPFADDNKVPWDVSTESGRALKTLFSAQAKENHTLRQELRRITRQVGEFGQRETTRTIAQHEESWKAETLAAAKEVPDFARPSFVRAIQRAFDLAKERKLLGKIDVKRLVQEELAPFKRANKGQQRTKVAGQQRRAEGNRSLSRPQGQGRTSAANPNETNRVGTIKDARKAFFDRVGMQRPAGRS